MRANPKEEVNPFVDHGMQLRFGLMQSAESAVTPFANYTASLKPYLYHVQAKGSEHAVWSLPLLPCDPAWKQPYSTIKEQGLLCPDLTQGLLETNVGPE